MTRHRISSCKGLAWNTTSGEFFAWGRRAAFAWKWSLGKGTGALLSTQGCLCWQTKPTPCRTNRKGPQFGRQENAVCRRSSRHGCSIWCRKWDAKCTRSHGLHDVRQGRKRLQGNGRKRDRRRAHANNNISTHGADDVVNRRKMTSRHHTTNEEEKAPVRVDLRVLPVRVHVEM